MEVFLTLFSDGVNLEGMNHTRQNIELLKLLTAISLEIQQLQQTTESRLSRLESILAKMNGNNKSAGDLGLNDSEHSKVLTLAQKKQGSLNSKQYLIFLASQGTAHFHTFKKCENSSANNERAFQTLS